MIKNNYNSEIYENNKLHFSSYAIFLGMIFLFAGTGSNIQFAGNFLFFTIAIIFNIIHLALNHNKLHISITYTLVALLYLLWACFMFYSIGNYTSGIILSLVLALLLTITTTTTEYNNKDINLIIRGIIYSAVIFSILILFFGNGFSQAINHKYTYTQTFGEHIEFEPNFVGILIITGFEFSFIVLIKMIERKKKFASFLYILFTFITLIAGFKTGSRNVLLALAVYGILLIFFINNKKTRNKLLFLVLVLIIFFILMIYFEIIPQEIYTRFFEDSYNDGSNDKRLINWSYGFKAMFSSFLGNGPHDSAVISYRLFNYPNAAHNTYIAMGTYFGVPGFLIFLIMIINLIVRAWKCKQRELFAILLSLAVSWNILECHFSIAMWSVIIVSIMIIQKSEKDSKYKLFT